MQRYEAESKNTLGKLLARAAGSQGLGALVNSLSSK
jgi:hypothetical protein